MNKNSRTVEDVIGNNIVLEKVERADGKFGIDFEVKMMGMVYKASKSWNKEKVRDKRFNDFSLKRATKLSNQFLDKAIDKKLKDIGDDSVSEMAQKALKDIKTGKLRTNKGE